MARQPEGRLADKLPICLNNECVLSLVTIRRTNCLFMTQEGKCLYSNNSEGSTTKHGLKPSLRLRHSNRCDHR